MFSSLPSKRTEPSSIELPPAPDADGDERIPRASRVPYDPPTLESLGAWSALTLQQSIPIGPNLIPLLTWLEANQ